MAGTSHRDPKQAIPRLGLGVAWRPGIADAIEAQTCLQFTELHAENFILIDNFAADEPLPDSVQRLQKRGMTLVPHAVTLSVGGASPPPLDRIDAFADLVRRTGAPLFSDHCCFVRGGGYESGHLLPIPRSRDQLEIVVENIRLVQSRLPVPFALENIAAMFEWPGAEMDEATFIGEIVEAADCLLLIDIANLYANARNLRWDAAKYLDRLPLERLAYVHMAGGMLIDGLYHDTHSQTPGTGILGLLEELAARVDPPGVLLERDDNFPTTESLTQELHLISSALARGRVRREIGRRQPPPGQETSTSGIGLVTTRPIEGGRPS